MFEFITRLCLSAICVLWYCNHSSRFVDGWHEYSRETYVHLNIHDLPNTILLLFLRAAEFPRKLNEWLVLRIVGASPLPACYHRPSSEAWSSGLANLDPSRRDIFCPRFHPAQMHRMPDEECVGGSVYVCSLGISQTCGGREGIMAWSCKERRTKCQEWEQCSKNFNTSPLVESVTCACVCAHAN